MNNGKQTQGLHLLSLSFNDRELAERLRDALLKGLNGHKRSGEELQLQISEGGHKLRLLVNGDRPTQEATDHYRKATGEFCCHGKEKGRDELRHFHFDCSQGIIRVTMAELATV